ncbi:hypothetical protein SDC9_182225 [bioreactor metagenome]|uniref:Uncharacterized protein n=1 Tax=bioreactor metagenome TaxID=1076179 RepID=A0A645H6T7_9ZZZZ
MTRRYVPCCPRAVRWCTASRPSMPRPAPCLPTCLRPSTRLRRMPPCRPPGQTPSPSSCSPRDRPSCPRPSSTPMECGAPTSSRLPRPCPIWSKARPCWWTGCPGITLSAATRTSASRSITVALSISTRASLRRRALPRRCAICARSLPPFTSTYPRASNTSPVPWRAMRSCAAACSSASRCSSTPEPLWRSPSGIA